MTQDTIIQRNVTYKTFGGAVLYSAVLAREFGLSAAIVTSAREEFPFKKIIGNIRVKNIISRENTQFQNNYLLEKRQQYVKAHADKIDFSKIPREWLKSKIVLLAPIFREFLSFPQIFESSFIGCNLQGWIREKDENGRIREVKEWNHFNLSGLDLVVFSDEEVKKSSWDYFASRVKYVAVTSGSNGVYISVSGKWSRIPSFSSNSVDTTGAGDVWSSAFMIFLQETKDIILSGNIANVAAGLSIEGIGFSKIPNRDVVQRKLHKAGIL